VVLLSSLIVFLTIGSYSYLIFVYSHTNICEEEISACCLDDRERKVVIGDIRGRIGVYNSSNGALMKSVYHSNTSIVIGLQYFNEVKRFLAGYQNGEICLYDENDIEECHMLRSFELFNRHPELLSFGFCPESRTVMTSGACSNVARLWAYDSGKCEAELHLGSTSQGIVVATAMLLPIPLVIVSDSTGNVVIWGSKGSRWCGLRISGFLNQTPPTAEMEPTTSHKVPGTDEYYIPRALPLFETKPLNETSSSINASLSPDSTPLVSIPHPPARQRGLRASIHPMSEMVRYDEMIKKQSQFEANRLIRQSETKWGRVSAAQTIAWDAQQNLLFTGDDLGAVRCMDISDIINDLGNSELLMKETTSGKLKGICRSKRIDHRSALPPMYEEDHADEFDAAASVYLLGRAGNCMAYLGVQFKWAMTAHHDRLINLTVIPGRGFITTAADRMVKMWKFDGQPLGTLLQSVPVGVRNRNWFLEMDVDAMVQHENRELDEIIARATYVSEDPRKPEIESMDFSGMETADFAQSALRQRVDRSAKILGLDFPSNTTHAGHGDKGLDDSSVSDQSILSLSTSLSSINKPLGDALKELKSTHAAVDYQLKTKQLSYIQQKRKAHKLETISKQYEGRTGILIKTPGPKDPSVTLQDEEEKSQAKLDKILTTKESDLIPPKDEHSVNSDMYSVHEGGEPGSKPITSRRSSSVKSKIVDSIKQAHERGPRTISMVQSCRKYTAFNALDVAMKDKSRAVNASQEELDQIRAVREKKHKDLMSMISSARNNNKSSKLPMITENLSKPESPLKAGQETNPEDFSLQNVETSSEVPVANIEEANTNIV
jgi:hypothetical protein